MKRNLLLLLISLILMSCSIHPKNVVGEVAGRQIPSNYYFNVFRQKMAEFEINSGRKPNKFERKKIEDVAWKQITETMVYQKLYSDNKLSVSNDEIEDYLINNIPKFLKGNAKLRWHNKFSESLYSSSVKTNSPLDLSKLKKDVYYVIMNKKLKDKVLRNFKPTENEIKQEMEKYQIEGDLNIYQFDSSDFNLNVVPDEIKQYYLENINDFKTKAFVDLEYVTFPVKLGENDFSQTKSIADSLFTEFKKGVSFSLVINQKSDLYFGEEKPFTYVDSLNSVLKKQLSKLSEKQFSKPFLYKNSYYLLDLERRTKNMVKYMVLEIPVKPTDNTLQAVKNKVLDFKELSDEIGFDKAAVETSHTLINTGKIYLKNPNIKGLGRSDSIILKALKSQDNILVKFHPILNEYILFYVKSKHQRGFKKLSECKSEINKKVMMRKMKQKFSEMDNTGIRKLIKSGRSKISHMKNITFNNFEKRCVGFENLKKPLFMNPEIGKLTNLITLDNSIAFSEWMRIQKKNIDILKYRKKALKLLKARYFKEYIENSFLNSNIKDWRRKLN